MPTKADVARSNRQRGKRNEKDLCKILGGERVGIFGGEDIAIKDKKISIEAKSRQSFVAEKWMEQSEKNCKGKLPLVIVHIKGKNHNKDLVLIRLEQFKDLIK
ncbi:MAG TPA: hypothetical protein PL042_05115 [Caldisericia bacterium]|jgi:hypothetical protein|nr:hypothetical protein [Caldisericia bacterium]